MRLIRAYRQIPIDLRDRAFVGYAWKGNIYFDLMLSMGLRSSAHICQRLTHSLAYMYRNLGFEIVNYLDDFAGVEIKQDVDRAFFKLKSLLSACRIEESEHKVYAPSTRMEFLGIVCDSVKLTLEISDNIILEIKNFLREWNEKKKAAKREIQSLVGKFNCIGSCVKPGRIFVCRILNWLRDIYEKVTVLIPKIIIKKRFRVVGQIFSNI